MIILDSSAAVGWLLGLPLSDVVAERLLAADSVHMPALLDIEVAHVMRRYAADGDISDSTANRALHALADLDAIRYSHETLLPLIWRLRHNLTAYDAAFVALYAALDAPLVTLDGGIARAPWPLRSSAPIRIDYIR